jgi:hypothetical protein
MVQRAGEWWWVCRIATERKHNHVLLISWWANHISYGSGCPGHTTRPHQPPIHFSAARLCAQWPQRVYIHILLSWMECKRRYILLFFLTSGCSNYKMFWSDTLFFSMHLDILYIKGSWRRLEGMNRCFWKLTGNKTRYHECWTSAQGPELLGHRTPVLSAKLQYSTEKHK